MKIKINYHGLAMFFLYLYLFLLPVDAALGNILGSISLINYVAVTYTIIRISELILKKYKLRIKNIRENRFLIFYPLYCFFTVLIRQTEEYSKFMVLSMVISFIVFFLAIIDDYTKEDTKKIKCVIQYSILSVIVIFILFADFRRFNGRLAFKNFNSSSTMDPNFFTIGLCILTSVCFNNIMRKEKKIISIISIIFILVIIFMTGSRSGLISNSIVIAISFILSNYNIKNKILFLVFLPIIIIITMNLINIYVPQKILNRYSYKYTEKDAGAGRFNIWKNAMEVYSNNNIGREILGTGSGTFLYAIANKSIYNHSHNIYIQALCENGIIGLFLLIGMMLSTIKKTWKNKNYIMLAAVIGLCFGGMRS